MKTKKWQLIRLALAVAIFVLPTLVPGDPFIGTTWAYRAGAARLVVTVLALLTFLTASRPMAIWARVELVGFFLLAATFSLDVLLVYWWQSSNSDVLFGGIILGVPYISALSLIVCGNLLVLLSKQESPSRPPETTRGI